MVNFWDEELKNAIKLTKIRIKHHEKHGNGNSAMQDKKTLVKQERTLELRKIKN